MNYKQAIEANVKHMATSLSEWTAVEMTGFVEVEAGGEAHTMPTFNFPQGYTSAPTLYKSNADGACCELCAHPIKMAYWIQNDSKKWTMMVGSECVTHFGGKSGQELAKEKTWANNRELLAHVKKIERAVYRKYTYSFDRGYGRRGREWVANNEQGRKAYADYSAIAKTTKSLDEYTSEAGITRWKNKNGETIQKFIDTYENLLNS